MQKYYISANILPFSYLKKLKFRHKVSFISKSYIAKRNMYNGNMRKQK